jgi:hypothetical protein
MSIKPPRRRQATTIRVGDGGSLSMDIGPGGFGAGFSQLMNFNVPTFTPKPLATGETTKVGFVRTGDAIARALAKASDRFEG